MERKKSPVEMLMAGIPATSYLSIDTTHLSSAGNINKLEILRERHDALMEDNIVGLICAGVDINDIHIASHQGVPKQTIYVKGKPVITLEVAMKDTKVEFREIHHGLPYVKG